MVLADIPDAATMHAAVLASILAGFACVGAVSEKNATTAGLYALSALGLLLAVIVAAAYEVGAVYGSVGQESILLVSGSALVMGIVLLVVALSRRP